MNDYRVVGGNVTHEFENEHLALKCAEALVKKHGHEVVVEHLEPYGWSDGVTCSDGFRWVQVATFGSGEPGLDVVNAASRFVSQPGDLVRVDKEKGSADPTWVAGLGILMVLLMAVAIGLPAVFSGHARAATVVRHRYVVENTQGLTRHQVQANLNTAGDAGWHLVAITPTLLVLEAPR